MTASTKVKCSVDAGGVGIEGEGGSVYKSELLC